MVRAGIRAWAGCARRRASTYLVEPAGQPDVGPLRRRRPGRFRRPPRRAGLLAAYARYAKDSTARDPADVPADDQMGFPSEDRMLETPYWIAYALCRLPLDDPQTGAAAAAGPAVDGQPAGRSRHVHALPAGGRPSADAAPAGAAGLRQEACEQALLRLGQPRRVPAPADDSALVRRLRRTASPAGCRACAPRRRTCRGWWPCWSTRNGWVRINAAKALAWLGDRRAIEPLARLLARGQGRGRLTATAARSRTRSTTIRRPRWREGAGPGAWGCSVPTSTPAARRAILNDERSVLEVRHAAAEALADLGNPRGPGRARKRPPQGTILQHPPRRPRCPAAPRDSLPEPVPSWPQRRSRSLPAGTARSRLPALPTRPSHSSGDCPCLSRRSSSSRATTTAQHAADRRAGRPLAADLRGDRRGARLSAGQQPLRAAAAAARRHRSRR